VAKAKSTTSKRSSSKGTKTTKSAKSTKGTARKSTTAKSAKTKEVAVSRRQGERREASDRRKGNQPVAVERREGERRAKVNRRRQIDPTTCERDYTQEEIEFMNAMDLYKRRSGRMFPTCSEVLEVIRGLGYLRVGQPSGEFAGIVEASVPGTPQAADTPPSTDEAT